MFTLLLPIAGEVREAPVVKVPGIAVAMQHSLLKRISAFRTKEVRRACKWGAVLAPLLVYCCPCNFIHIHVLATDVSTGVLQELLEFVASYHMLLDPINLVTCLYRLAKMSKESSRGRAGFLAELQRSSTFQLLLRKLHM